MPVVAKLPISEYPTPDELARLRREFDIGRSLTSSRVPSYLALEECSHGLALVMDDFGGQALKRTLGGHAMPVDEFLPIAIEVVLALAEVHQHDLIHRDINPNNIVINEHTRQVKLIDFSIASRLPRESPALAMPEALEGSLEYIAPEQTGRINRPVDYRADYYALGATFYEMLSGAPPFHSDDPAELVYSHIARRQTPLSDLVPEVPLGLSDLVDKLLAKSAEDRYASSFGIASDLRVCLEAFEYEGAIARFSLGKSDVPERFQPPHKLYGREDQVAALLAACERASDRAREMVLVSGWSGIGKSALVGKIRDALAPRRGYFVAGKFDQTRRDRPYSAVLDACEALAQQVLSESAARIDARKTALEQALGSAVDAVVELLPSFEPLLGPRRGSDRGGDRTSERAPTADVDHAQARRRLHSGVRRLLDTFASPDHPLVVFLDDLQWADLPSLDLVRTVIADSDQPGLLVIGAFRENEVTAVHPVSRMVDALERTGVNLTRIELEPLTVDDVARLVSDALYHTVEIARPLAALVWEKTEGNPFFVNEFLASLYQRRLLYFDAVAGRWEWKLDAIRQLPITDDLADIMQLRLRDLGETGELLALCACLGDDFELGHLARLHRVPPAEAAAALGEAMALGLIAPLDDSYKYAGYHVASDAAPEPPSVPPGQPGGADGGAGPDAQAGAGGPPGPSLSAERGRPVRYRFLHDRIREAASARLSPQRRREVHLAIGRILLADTPPGEVEERVFDIVDHFHHAGELLVEPGEQARVAQLAILAGRRAMAAVAFASAAHYTTAGLALMERAGVELDPAALFDLRLSLAENLYLSSNYDGAEQLLSTLRAGVQSPLDALRVSVLLIRLHIDRTNPKRALAYAVEAMREVGEDIPDTPEELAQTLDRELQQVSARFDDARLDELGHALDVAPPTEQAIAALFRAALSAGMMAGDRLWLLVVLRLLGRATGPALNDAEITALYMFGCHLLSDPRTLTRGLRYTDAAVALAQTSDDVTLRAGLPGGHATSSLYWRHHARDGIERIQRSLQQAYDEGEVNLLTGLPIHLVNLYMFCGTPLSHVLREVEGFIAYAWRTGNKGGSIVPRYRYTLELAGEPGEPDYVAGQFDEAEFERTCREEGSALVLINFLAARVQARYVMADYAAAARTALVAHRASAAIAGTIAYNELQFYLALAAAAPLPDAAGDHRDDYERILVEGHDMLRAWARSCPVNFESRFLLVDAELARVRGNDERAMAAYDEALDAALAEGFLHNAALAAERAARFYAARGRTRIARAYVEEAKYAYGRWGAGAKIAQLDHEFADLLASSVLVSAETDSTTGSTSGTRAIGHLDIATVIQATQAISSDLKLDSLLRQLVGTVMKSAGASRVVLLLRSGDELRVEAEATAVSDRVQVLPSVAADAYGLPATIVHYVERTRQQVLIDATRAGHRFGADPYLHEHRLRSVFCAPIVYRGALTGVLYLENQLVRGVFSPGRVQLVGILSSQAAISIENAKLYQELGRTHERVASLERERLMARLSHFQAVVEASNDFVGLFSLAGDVVYINPSGMALLGRTGDSPSSWGLADIYPPAVSRRLREEVFPTVEAAGSWTGELVLQRADGSALAVSQSVTLVKNERGDRIGFGTIARDITETKRRERELRRSKAAAESANRAKSQFLANMSHEIRTPMNAIIGMTQLLLDSPLVTQQQQYVAIIRDSGDSLLTLINDILDLSKIEARSLPLHHDPFDLRTCCEAALDLLAPRAAEKGLSLAYEIAVGTPEAIIGDANRLRQILVNLIGNAVKFTEAGRIVLRVHANPPDLRDDGSVVGDHELHFDVSDTGIGIDADQIDRLFKPFAQLDASATRRYGGTGLGLAICKLLVEKMDGRIWVRSTSGRGSSFQFTIRAPSAPDAETPAFLALEQPDLSGKHIAIVADDPVDREILSAASERWGMRTSLARTTDQLRALVSSDRADVVLSAMPPDDGDEAVVDAARAAGPRPDGAEPIPIIAVRPVGALARAPRARAVVLELVKPVKLAHLHRALIEALIPRRARGRTAPRPSVPPQPALFDQTMAARVPLTILLAEDNDVNRKVVQLMLRRLGYEPDTATNGLEAVEAVRQRRYDLVFMDIQMPEMDGIEATQQIIDMVPPGQRPRIVAMTALAMEGDREQLLAAGAHDYISKPIRVKQLLEILARCAAELIPPGDGP